MAAHRERGLADFVTQPGQVTVDNLDAEMAGWLVKQREFQELRYAARGAHPAVYAYLTAVTVVGQKWASSVRGTSVENSPEQASELRSWVTSQEAADLLGVGPRAVRQAIVRGRLEASSVEGRWQIERDDLEHYRATRANRAA